MIAVLSLMAALIFNGVQTRQNAQALRESKLATELGLLTQLQSVMSESVYSRVRHMQQFEQLRLGQRSRLTPSAYRAAAEEAANMEYFAWLFNRGFLTVSGADELWGPLMICEYQQAFALMTPSPAQEVPELVRFIRSRGRKLSRHALEC